MANTIGGYTVKKLVKKLIYGDFPSKLSKSEVVIRKYFYLNSLFLGVLMVPS